MFQTHFRIFGIFKNVCESSQILWTILEISRGEKLPVDIKNATMNQNVIECSRILQTIIQIYEYSIKLGFFALRPFIFEFVFIYAYSNLVNIFQTYLNLKFNFNKNKMSSKHLISNLLIYTVGKISYMWKTAETIRLSIRLGPIGLQYTHKYELWVFHQEICYAYSFYKYMILRM